MHASLSPVSRTRRHLFLTVTLMDRQADLMTRPIAVPRGSVARTRLLRPFHIDAYSVLPEQTRCIIELRPGDDDLSKRIKAIKTRFVEALPPTERRSAVRGGGVERGIGY